MFAEAPHRIKLLKGLSFSTDALSAPVAQLLIDFLVRFGPEIKLDICHVADAEAFFDSDPALRGADLTTSTMLKSAQAMFSRVVLDMTAILPQDEVTEDGMDKTTKML